jgi:hypothetical protein
VAMLTQHRENASGSTAGCNPTPHQFLEGHFSFRQTRHVEARDLAFLTVFADGQSGRELRHCLSSFQGIRSDSRSRPVNQWWQGFAPENVACQVL